jgi:hypothetical protein
MPAEEDFPVAGLPGRDEPEENLPVVYSARHGRLAFRSNFDGVDVLQLDESGRPPVRLGTYPNPAAPPRIDGEAAVLLRGYLGYSVERDHLLWAAAARVRSGAADSVDSELERLLRWAGSAALARGRILADLDSTDPGALGIEAVAQGIRATDAELLDRPTLGTVL